MWLSPAETTTGNFSLFEQFEVKAKSQCVEGMRPKRAAPASTKQKGRRRRAGASLAIQPQHEPKSGVCMSLAAPGGSQHCSLGCKLRDLDWRGLLQGRG